MVRICLQIIVRPSRKIRASFSYVKHRAATFECSFCREDATVRSEDLGPIHYYKIDHFLDDAMFRFEDLGPIHYFKNDQFWDDAMVRSEDLGPIQTGL